MKSNYLFRDKTFLMRQVVGGWTILIVGVVLFALIAVLLSQRINDDVLVIGVSFIVAAPFVVLAHVYLYQHERKWYRIHQVKLLYDTLPDDQLVPFTIDNFQKLKKEYDQLYRDVMRIKSDNQNMLVQLVRLRRRCQNIGRIDLIKEVDDIEQDVQRSASGLNEQLDFIIEQRQQLNRSIAEVQSFSTSDFLVQKSLILNKQREQATHQLDLATQLRQRFNTVRSRT